MVERDLFKIAAICKLQIINIAEYLNTNYKDDQFVNIVKATTTINQTWTQQLKQQQSLQKH